MTIDQNAIPLTVQMIHQRVFKSVLQRQQDITGKATIELAVITLLDTNRVEYQVNTYGLGLDPKCVGTRRYPKLHDAIDGYNKDRGL